MQIRKILPAELTWVNAQYASINFLPSPASDFIVVAEVDGVKAGLGRITEVENDAAELGGIFVLPEFRGQSVASHVVDFLSKHSKHPKLFCIPFVHLETFYQRFGFSPIDPTITVPQKIIQKMNWCGTAYETPMVLLCRSNL